MDVKSEAIQGLILNNRLPEVESVADATARAVIF